MKFTALRGLLAASFISIASTFAASDYLLVIDGIQGESRDARRPGSIEIDSFSWGVSQTAAAGTTSTKPSFSDINFTKALDKSSPLLYLNCANGKHLKGATFYVRKTSADQVLEYYVIKLTDVVVTSIQTSGSSDLPRESFSLNYAKIEVDYSPQKPDGTLETPPIHFGWDVKANVAVP